MESRRETLLRSTCIGQNRLYNDKLIIEDCLPKMSKFEIDPLSELLKDPNSENYHSDVWLISNEERLRENGSLELDSLILQRFTECKPRNLNLTEEQYFAIIPSRRLDGISERLQFLDYLEKTFDEKSSELRKVLEDSQKEISSVSDSSDNANVNTE